MVHEADERCTFCRVIAGALPASFVYEAESVVAFLDHRPLFAGHALVVPRQHVRTLTDLPVELVGPLFEAARTLARAIEDAMGAEGTFVALNNRVSQSVPHLHVHVVPRRRKDGLRGFFWPRTKYDGAADEQETAARIRHALSEHAGKSGGEQE